MRKPFRARFNKLLGPDLRFADGLKKMRSNDKLPPIVLTWQVGQAATKVNGDFIADVPSSFKRVSRIKPKDLLPKQRTITFKFKLDCSIEIESSCY